MSVKIYEKLLTVVPLEKGKHLEGSKIKVQFNFLVHIQLFV